MRPNIIEGDRIFVNKLAYSLKVPYTAWHIKWWGAPKRGDVVVFYEPESGTRLVKRVVGMPGDRIEVREDRLVINGQTIQYSTAPDARQALPMGERTGYEFLTEQLEGRPHPVMIMDNARLHRELKPNVPEFTVPEAHYFVMGDNRDHSRDSRYFKTDANGCIPIESIVGRASRTIFSLDYNDSYLPRGDRWFKKLP
jgi:signal peptidase I